MDKPNIVLIVSDDHGYADRGALGIHADVKTPALDRLAAEGISFTNAYATAPICSPSRTAIMTGQYQQRWGGLWFSSTHFPDDPNVETLAEMLGKQGYRTGYFGKVHYGPEKVGDRGCPPHHGFETTLYGLAGQSMGRLNYLHHSEEAVEEYGPRGTVTMAVQPLLSGDDPVELEEFLTDALGERAREFIADESDERPFFCMLAFNAVHNFCWQLPEEELQRRGLPGYHDWKPDSGTEYTEWYDDAIVPNLPHGREYYLAQLELMDAQIGLVMQQLDDLGIAEDTLIVYITDNGGSTCNFGNNAPLRGTKYTMWEGGIRIPMLWRWPGTIPAGEERAMLASTLDLMATFREISESSSDGPCDGVSLVPELIHQDESAHEDRGLHWECGFQFAVREGDWKLAWVDGDSPAVEHLSSFEHAPMGSGWQLTNLREDVGETTDRLADEPEIARDLLDSHTRWLESLQITEIVPERDATFPQ